ILLALPAIMRECAVSICHAVRVFTLLHSSSAVIGCIKKFAGKALDHRLLIAATSGSNQPTDRESLATLRTDINRNLVSCTTNTARAHFKVRSNIIQSLMENVHRLLLRLFTHLIKRAINNAFSNGLPAI